MDISAVITQLRTYCPALAFVGGAADWAKGLETTVNPASLPAGYVVPYGDEAGENTLQNGLLQQVTEHVSVIVEFDNSSDRRGFAAINQVEDMKYAIFSALLNWRIDPIKAQKGLNYGGAEFIDMDRGRVWYAYRFELITTIIDTDGFPFSETDLTAIRIDVELEPQTPTPDDQTPVEVDVFLFADQTIVEVIGAEGEGAAGVLPARAS